MDKSKYKFFWYKVSGGLALIISLLFSAHYIIMGYFSIGSLIVSIIIPLVYIYIWANSLRYAKTQLNYIRYENIILLLLPLGIISTFTIFVITSLSTTLQNDAFIRFFISPIVTFFIIIIWCFLSKLESKRKTVVLIIYTTILILYYCFLFFMVRYI